MKKDNVEEKKEQPLAPQETISQIHEVLQESAELKKPSAKTQEIPQDDGKSSDRLELSEELKKEAEEKAESIVHLDDEQKIKNLLAIAEKKGVDFVIHAAKKMKNDYILDRLHDELVKDEKYKKFYKKK